PPGRRADSEKYRIRRANGRCRFGRKGQSTGFDIGCNERVQAGFEDRDLSVLELPDLRCIPIDTGYEVPEIRKTGAGHEPDVAGTDHCYSHEMLSVDFQLASFLTCSKAYFIRCLGVRDRLH